MSVISCLILSSCYTTNLCWTHIPSFFLWSQTADLSEGDLLLAYQNFTGIRSQHWTPSDVRGWWCGKDAIASRCTGAHGSHINLYHLATTAAHRGRVSGALDQIPSASWGCNGNAVQQERLGSHPCCTTVVPSTRGYTQIPWHAPHHRMYSAKTVGVC